MQRIVSHLSVVVVVLAMIAAPAANALTVVASLGDLGAITREVAKEHATVVVLASPRQDPHYVDPRPSFLVSLTRADLVVVNGLELEASWMTPLLVQARNADIQPGSPGYFDASTVVRLTQAPAAPVSRSMGDVHPGGNPHFTFDPRAAAAVALAVAERLAALDPDHTNAYRTNAKAFADEMTKLAEEQRARFAKLAKAQRRVVTYHQSLLYLWDWLDVEEVINVEPRPGIAPDPAHVAKVLKLMKAQKLDVIVQEDFYPTHVSQTLMNLTGNQKSIVLLEGATRFDDGQTYRKHVEHNLEVLHAALSQQPAQ